MAYRNIYKPTYENVFEFVGRYLDKWKYFYPDDQEIMPRHIPESLGKFIVIKDHVDVNHVRNMANRRSHYGIIIYANISPIIYESKR